MFESEDDLSSESEVWIFELGYLDSHAGEKVRRLVPIGQHLHRF